MKIDILRDELENEEDAKNEPVKKNTLKKFKEEDEKDEGKKKSESK